MMIQTTKPARRVLHVCYCCAEVDGPVAFFTHGLGLHETMRTPGEPTSGAILGMDYDVQGVAAFVYDARGPRVSPAIEVQSWLDPPLVGKPFAEPNHAGVHALGFAVGDLRASTAALASLGARVGDAVTSPVFDAPSAAVVDPFGMKIELVERADATDGESRMHHLRVTCADLDRSIEWYGGLGFERVGAPIAIAEGSAIGAPGPVEATACRMRLPDEPMEIVLVHWHDPAVIGRHYEEPNHAGWFRLALGVDDTRAAYEAMSADGWDFDRDPMLITLDGTPVPDMWITFTSDPDGVPFELVQRPRSAFKERSA